MRLGQIGDQVFGLAITDLIQDLYPYLRVGPASVCQCLSFALCLVPHCNYPEIERSHKAQKRDRRDVMPPLSSHEVIDNIIWHTLSCVSYGLHKKVNLPERHDSSIRASQSVQGISLALHSHGYISDS
jgi:hypothetical protein